MVSQNDMDIKYTWDGKLKAADTDGDGTDDIEITYDPAGNRIYKRSGTDEHKYIVDTITELPVILLDIDMNTQTIDNSCTYTPAGMVLACERAQNPRHFDWSERQRTERRNLYR